MYFYLNSDTNDVNMTDMIIYKRPRDINVYQYDRNITLAIKHVWILDSERSVTKSPEKEYFQRTMLQSKEQ